MSGKQREVRLFGKHILVGRSESEHIPVTAKVIEVVAKIDGSVAIFGQLAQYLVSEPRRFQVLASVEQITLALTHDARIVIQGASGAVYPSLGQIKLAGFDGGVGAISNNHRI